MRALNQSIGRSITAINKTLITQSTYLGQWKRQTLTQQKHRLSDSVSFGSEKEFLEEALRMSKFHHDRVLPLLGISLPEDGPAMIVTPFMEVGNLLKYLRAHESVSLVCCVMVSSFPTRGAKYVRTYVD